VLAICFQGVIIVIHKQENDMNRKRNPSESFSQYRANLKTEAKALKARLAGKFIHISKYINSTRGDGTTYRR